MPPDSFYTPAKTSANNFEKEASPATPLRVNPHKRSNSAPRNQQVRLPVRSTPLRLSHTNELNQSDLFDKYRAQNFDNIPIYRVNPIALIRNNYQEGHSQVLNSSVDVVNIDDSPPKINLSLDHCPNCNSRVENARFYPNRNLRGSSVCFEKRTTSPLLSKATPYKTEFGPQYSKSKELSTASQYDFPLVDACHKPGEFYRFTNSNPNEVSYLRRYQVSRSRYPISKEHSFDYPYLIIQSEKRKEPEILNEKTRKKGDQMNDPFFGVPAKTRVVENDINNQRKSNSHMQFENPYKLGDNSGGQSAEMDESVMTVAWPAVQGQEKNDKNRTDRAAPFESGRLSRSDQRDPEKRGTFIESSSRNDGSTNHGDSGIASDKRFSAKDRIISKAGGLIQRLDAMQDKSQQRLTNLMASEKSASRYNGFVTEKANSANSGSSLDNLRMNYTTPPASSDR